MAITLQSLLERDIRGQVRFDRLARTLYSVDASIYEMIPAGVVLPRDDRDVITTVNHCRDHGVSIIPRGAGTGLAGGAVGCGMQIDCSRFMNRIRDFDLKSRTVRVEPGVVLDELNAFLAPHGMHFAPDVATSSRATIGGMIANNSCGAHSVLYKRTVDHLASVTVVLSDGSLVTWPSNGSNVSSRADTIVSELKGIADTYRDDIEARFPKVLRRNGGYALDRICVPDRPVNPAQIICGSEGTLGVICEAVLKLTRLPHCKALLLIHFEQLRDALDATPFILKHQPAAVELLDSMITEAAAADPASRSVAKSFDPRARALLMVEFFEDQQDALQRRIDRLRQELASHDIGYGYRGVSNPREQKSVWDMRSRGLGLLMSRPGDDQSYAFVEDSAVDPARLRDYIERFEQILTQEGVHQAGYYAHASVGVIHVRPVLNLKTADGIDRMYRVADRVSDLALEFGGAMTGEHGDGLVRSCWNKKMYGPRIVEAFGRVKKAFDREALFNPGKIVDPLEMTENLRYGPGYRTMNVKTHLDFSAYGGLSGMAEMCSGVGECRKRLVGTMCPSYRATHDETHTTRARANALRAALSNRGLIEGLDDPALDDVMDLCLLCKACKTECPTGVDMARMKVEWLSARNMRDGVPRSARFIAGAARLARLGSRLPRISNAILGSLPARTFLERRYGLDRRIAPPRLAHKTFHHWFRRHHSKSSTRNADRQNEPDSLSEYEGSKTRPTVVYYADTWTNYYTPEVGIAAVKLLEAAGFCVLAPSFECCGRPLISVGMLTEARHLARMNVERLARFADTQTPIIGTEPSCILTLVDEYPQLVGNDDARAVAQLAQQIETFLAGILRHDPDRIPFGDAPRRILYHGHCHQKAITGTADAMTVLNHPPGFSATEIDSGCCGMAGSFGYQKDHYAIARAIAEDRLLPAIRSCQDSDIAVSGFSCRHQIAHHTSAEPRHAVELLAGVLVQP